MKFRIDTKNDVWLGDYWVGAGDAYYIVAALCEPWSLDPYYGSEETVIVRWYGGAVFVGSKHQAREYIAHRILADHAP